MNVYFFKQIFKCISPVTGVSSEMVFRLALPECTQLLARLAKKSNVISRAENSIAYISERIQQLPFRVEFKPQMSKKTVAVTVHVHKRSKAKERMEKYTHTHT